MKKEQIIVLVEKFEAASAILREIECCSAGALLSLVGFADWRNFFNVNSACVKCESSS